MPCCHLAISKNDIKMPSCVSFLENREFECASMTVYLLKMRLNVA